MFELKKHLYIKVYLFHRNMKSIFRIRKSKKGQQEAGAMAAAALIAIIALLIVAYILFLPPAEREKLLEGEEAENITEEEEVSILLSECWLQSHPSLFLQSLNL